MTLDSGDSLDLGHVAHALQACDLRTALEQVVAWWGADADVFLIDHAMSELRSLAGDQIKLGGPLRDAMLDGVVAHVDGLTFVPLLDRRQPIGALVHRHGPTGAGGGTGSEVRRAVLAGEVLAGVTRRFEDVERVRRRADMTVSAELQWAMLPARADRVCGYDVAAVLEPAYEVAGDMFDYACVDGRLSAYSFDAMGHGVRASLACSVALSAVRNVRRSGGGLVDQMTAANHAVEQEWNGTIFVTGVACRFDDDRITVVNAGHEPIRRRQGRSVECLDLPSDLPLGVAEYGGYFEHELDPLGDDQALYLLSDGSAEARGDDDEPLGAQRVNDALTRVDGGSLLSSATQFVNAVVQYMGDTDVMDDLTVVAVAPSAQFEVGDGVRS